ncbi:4Fe-4S binding protein [Natroniella sp. ANB-PHB2]|uniref:4Fe-4S binding protein n=1 Tax=Natroniella sp. ANB-PHB2 TaxID=3384444 RepID=UPI0038D3EC5C
MKGNLIRFIKNISWILLIFFLLFGRVNLLLGNLVIVCMLAPLVTSTITGKRIWCGFFCPRGSLYDNLIEKISFQRKIPSIFKKTYFKIGFLGLLIGNLLIAIYLVAGDWEQSGLIFYRLILATTLIGVFLGLIFKERIWCAFCPMGLLSNFFIKLKAKILGDYLIFF